MPLAPQRIRQIAEVFGQEPVRFPNASDATYVRDASERVLVRREGALMGDNGIQAEALWWLMAKHIGVPVPDAAIHCAMGRDGWLSERIDPVLHWSPARAPYVENLDELGGILALDSVTGNHDRHPANLLLECITESQMRAWAIDAANAAVSLAEDVERLGINPPEPHPDTKGISIDLVEPGALSTAERIRDISERELSEFVQEACILGNAADRTPRVFAAVRARCGLATELTKGYLNKLRSLAP